MSASFNPLRCPAGGPCPHPDLCGLLGASAEIGGIMLQRCERVPKAEAWLTDPDDVEIVLGRIVNIHPGGTA